MEGCNWKGCIWGAGHEGPHQTRAQADAEDAEKRIDESKRTMKVDAALELVGQRSRVVSLFPDVCWGWDTADPWLEHLASQSAELRSVLGRVKRRTRNRFRQTVRHNAKDAAREALLRLRVVAERRGMTLEDLIAELEAS